MNTYTLTDFDAAIDFAYGYRSSIAFCAKMVRAFEVYGTLTDAQVRSLLSMRAARRAN
jgi:hypothetical protein